MLQNQVKILFVDTADFYSNREKRLDDLKHRLSIERKKLINGYSKKSNGKDDKVQKVVGLKQIEADLKKAGFDIKNFKEEEEDFSLDDIAGKERELFELYYNRKKLIKHKADRIKETKKQLLQLLENKVNQNLSTNGKHHIRVLNHNKDFDEEKMIAIFESSFSRTIGAVTNEFTDTFLEVQVYFYDIMKDLINFGFTYKGEKYRYFTSSAGQIRTKKCVFIKESIWQQYEKTIMCGLTIDAINAKGGSNPNKYLAYLALTNSATDVWKEFDIDKAIVIDDFETNVQGTYDLIDDTDYSIKRITGDVPIPHTDGAGMMLPDMGKNRMVRLPWIKGLLGVFDFVKFIEYNNCSPIIKDIYGKEHDVIAEGIQVIFTKSQFKMWKYYDSWEQYKEFYKEYHCDAAFMNPEADRIKNASINYQMLQTLTDITDDEIQEIAKLSVDKINNLCSSVQSVQEAFGVTPYNLDKTPYQKALQIYPDLMNDIFFKSKLKDLKDSMVKSYKSGKLKIDGKYTFVLPDFYAACEYWFGDIKNPKGLLDDGEVFCWLFRKSDKLDCLRSPHLFLEHTIRKNLAYKECEKRKQLREWFTTDAIYTSTHDLVSKILQFDVDGDMLLVVSDKTLIKVAERNIEKFDIVPLYYNMRKAKNKVLDNKAIYDGLNAAFSGGNIGLYSNDISKIWNSDVFVSSTEEEKQKAIDIIRLLCMENNFCIDMAKTLYMPERPKEIAERIKVFTKNKLPHFFIYTKKDKEKSQVEKANASFVNKLEGIIPNPRINMRNLGLEKIDYTLLLSNPKAEISKNDKLIAEYNSFNSSMGFDFVSTFNNKIGNLGDMDERQVKGNYAFYMAEKLKSVKDGLSKYGTPEEVADNLVLYLYGEEKKSKNLLWLAYGDIIFSNLKKNLEEKVSEEKKMRKRTTYSKYTKKKENTNKNPILTKDIQCVDCGEWFSVSNNDRRSCRCEKCKKEHMRQKQKDYMREKRKAQKAV